MGEYLQVADYFVVVTGLSRPHVKAIHQELHVRLKKLGEFHREPEGADMAWWVILDYDAVVVHALQAEAREYYDLDTLYSECAELDWREIELPSLTPPSEAAGAVDAEPAQEA